MRHVVTFQINSTENLPVTTIDVINSPKGKHMYLPVIGFPVAPIMMTIYCVKKDAKWSPPALGNSMMNHYKSEMKGKDYNFSFVQWQDLNAPKGEWDIALQFGGKNDSIFGV